MGLKNNNEKLKFLDVAAGTGDIGFLISDYYNYHLQN